RLARYSSVVRPPRRIFRDVSANAAGLKIRLTCSVRSATSWSRSVAPGRVGNPPLHDLRQVRFSGQARGGSICQHVVKLKRLAGGCQPFVASGGALIGAPVEGQSQLRKELVDLLLRGQMRQTRTGSQRRFVQVIERGQAARKEFPINDALREPD